jgi:hypothetical protein
MALAGGVPVGSTSVAKETCEMMLRLGSLVHQLQKVSAHVCVG